MLKMTKMLIAFLLIVSVGGCGKKAKTPNEDNLNPTETPQSQETAQPTAKPEETPASNNDGNEGDIVMEVPDLTSLDSINLIVNKQRPLGEDYEPADLVKPDVPLAKSSVTMRQEAADAMKIMFNAAKEDGISLMIGSGYRSYDYQKTLYNNYVARDGEEEANRYSAKPGQSEHQTGLAADLSGTSGNCYLKGCFKDTDEGVWLKENAWKYGFILRYPEGKEEITGYIFEPWHYRYFGTEEAQKIFESGLTVEEYYNLQD